MSHEFASGFGEDQSEEYRLQPSIKPYEVAVTPDAAYPLSLAYDIRRVPFLDFGAESIGHCLSNLHNFAKTKPKKNIVMLVTGVPGAGKTYIMENVILPYLHMALPERRITKEGNLFRWDDYEAAARRRRRVKVKEDEQLTNEDMKVVSDDITANLALRLSMHNPGGFGNVFIVETPGVTGIHLSDNKNIIMRNYVYGLNTYLVDYYKDDEEEMPAIFQIGLVPGPAAGVNTKYRNAVQNHEYETARKISRHFGMPDLSTIEDYNVITGGGNRKVNSTDNVRKVKSATYALTYLYFEWLRKRKESLIQYQMFPSDYQDARKYQNLKAALPSWAAIIPDYLIRLMELGNIADPATEEEYLKLTVGVPGYFLRQVEQTREVLGYSLLLTLKVLAMDLSTAYLLARNFEMVKSVCSVVALNNPDFNIPSPRELRHRLVYDDWEDWPEEKTRRYARGHGGVIFSSQ